MASDPRFKPVIQQTITELSSLELNDREHRPTAIQAWLDEYRLLHRYSANYGTLPSGFNRAQAANHLHFYRGDAESMRIASAASCLARRSIVAQLC